MAKLSLVSLGVVFGALPALAISPPASANYNAPHKWTDPVSGVVYVYIPGQTAGQPVAGLSTERAAATRVLTLNNCGWTSFTKSTTSPPVNVVGVGSTVNWSSKSAGAAPTCQPGTTAGTYVSSSNAATGSVIDDGTKIWIRGGTAAGSISVAVTADGAISTAANACGFLRIGASVNRPMLSFKIGSTPYSLATLPAVNNPMICRTVGTNSVAYVPMQ